MMHKYKTIREERKTLAIHVSPDGKLTVKAPIAATDDEVVDFVRRKKLWIEKQLRYFARFNKNTECDYASGTEIFFMGNQYKLVVRKVECVREYVELARTNIIVYSMFPRKKQRTRDILDNWLGQQTEKQFNLALRRVLKRFPDMPMPSLKVRKLSRRWGSFLKSGTIVLNPDLILVSKQCIEYVITHELCHYYHRDHSSAFFSLLGAKLPNWDKLKARLETQN